MKQEERKQHLIVAGILFNELEEDEQDAFMCASIETLANLRKMSPFDLIKQYVEAIIEVNSNENKRK